MKPPPLLSAVVLTCNRAERCQNALRHNARALAGFPSEILLINNGSEPVPMPETLDSVPVRVLPQKRNLGAEARNLALCEARGNIFFFMDDDVYIEQAHVAGLLDCMAAHPDAGAAAFRIVNGPDEEASLLPTVFHGCAVGIRRSALEKAGGYPRGYRYYAEEYHLSFRLLQEGFAIRYLHQLPPVQHARDKSGRSKAHIMERLVCNNTRLFTTFLPWRSWPSAMRDMLQRYRLVARKENACSGFRRGLAALPAACFRGLFERRPLTPDLFAETALLPQLERLLPALSRAAGHQLILCGTGRFPSLWMRTLRSHRIKVTAFLDSNPCWRNQHVGGVPVFQHLHDLPATFGQTSFFLLGLSSFCETNLWQKQLELAGHSPLPPEIVAPGKEFISGPSAPNLADYCAVKIFSHASKTM